MQIEKRGRAKKDEKKRRAEEETERKRLLCEVTFKKNNKKQLYRLMSHRAYCLYCLCKGKATVDC